jgi:hypothetical protein
MNVIASEAVQVFRRNITGDAGIKELRHYFNEQKLHILL